MTTTPRRQAPRNRSILDSPWLSIGLVIVVLAVAAALVLPGMLNPSGPDASGSPPPGSAGPGASPTTPGPTFVRPTPSPMPSFTTHLVSSGDTLNSIATEYGTTARSIAWWNRGAYPSLDPESAGYDPDRLEIGWRLVLIPNMVVDDNNPPTPSPGPIGTPEPEPTLGPNPTTAPNPTTGPLPTTAAGPATVISNGPRSASNIALTFDMGGRLEPAVQIVQWLIDHDVHATLFPTGKSATQTTQGLAAMQLAATRPDLFDLANHSWDHPDFRTLTAAEMAQQLTSTESALKPILGSTKPWFRPPYGGLSAAVREGVGAAGWRYVVMWDVDTIDWRPVADGGPTAADIVAKVRDRAQGGSIVLMHLGGWHTLEALPGLLDMLGDRGLTPVTLDEMLGA